MSDKKTEEASAVTIVIIIAVIMFGGYFAKKEGIITSGSLSSFTSSMSNKFSGGEYSGYGVQLVATSQLKQAKSIMNDFAKDGYSGFVLASKTKGRNLYKVRLGPYSERSEALAIKDKVVRRYPNNPYVKSSLVIFKPN